MTDPQEDTPCRDCKRPTQHATERCDDCRTPAGRLVTALAALGVKATVDDDHIVTDGEIRGYVAPGGWEIACDDVGDEVDAIEAAANAIAAIVQAPGLRLNIPREEYAHDVIQAFADGEEFGGKNVNRWFGHHYDIGDGEGPQFDARKAWQEHVTDRVGQVGPPEVAELRRERDTLAAEVKRLREELEKPVVDAWAGSVRLLDVCTVAWSTPAHFIPGKDEVGWWAQHPDGDLIASGPETGDAGRHAADLALLAAGYRLVGGAHPLPVAAECKHKWKNVPFSATGPDSDDGRDGPVCSICGEEWEVPDAR